MPFLTPLGVIAGLILAQRIAGASPAIIPLFAFITFSGALSMTTRDAIAVARNPLPIVVFLVSFHIVIPLLVRIASGLVFSGDAEYVTGFILLFAIPTAVSGYIWTSIHRGNGPLALALILLDTLLAPFVVPMTVSLLMGKAVSIDTGGMFVSLLLMVVIPSVLGVSINELSKGRLPLRIVPIFKPFSKLFLVAVIAINVSRLPGTLPPLGPDFIAVAALSVALSFGGFAVGRFASALLRLPVADTVSVTFATGMRNISAALVLAIAFFPPRAALPVVTGILFQQTLAALAGVGLIQKMVNRGHGNSASD